MKTERVLLVNPQITARRNARFPLSLLTLAGSLAPDYRSTLIDGNVDGDAPGTALAAVAAGDVAAVGLSVMGGPQVRPAIEISRAIRARAPHLPIIWGGYFPTLYPHEALRADYLDYAIRGQGEIALRELLGALAAGRGATLDAIRGLSWRHGTEVRHNANRPLLQPAVPPPLPYGLLGDPRQYCAHTFLGRRTVAHQAALGCRFRCSFCGVAAMFRGRTALPAAATLERDLRLLRDCFGADSIQFFDHNFFDREVDMVPLLEVLARLELPWWCYARANALLELSAHSWSLVRRSRLRMAYIGAESPNDALLHDVRKGTTAAQTLEVAQLCRHHGVIPEFSFMVAPPHDPEGETERTFEFIRRIKRVNPDAEIIVYIYTPVPAGAGLEGALPSRDAAALCDLHGRPVVFPRSPDEWTERRWVDYACHADAPWLSDRLRQRIRDFVTVLRCRFPTRQDARTPRWARLALRGLASWRYGLRHYAHPRELELSQRFIRLADPRATGI